MNKRLYKIFSILTLFILTLTVPTYAVVDIFDTDINTGIYKFSEHDKINLPFFRFSDSRIIIDKDINKLGFVFSGANIDIDSNMVGNQMIVATDTIRINKEVEDLAVLASNVIIDGKVNGNVVIYANNVTISKEAVIDEDIVIFSNTLNVDGLVNSNLMSYAKDINITGSITKDLRCEVTNLNIDENSNLQGKIYIKSENDINLPAKYNNAEIIKLSTLENLEDNKINVISLVKNGIILALVYILISSKTQIISKAINNIKSHPLLSIFIGFMMIILSIIIIVVLLLLTLLGLDIITIPILLLYGFFMIITLLISTLIMGSLITEYVYNKYEEKLNSKWYKGIIAFVVFGILMLIPYIPIIGAYIPMLMYMLSISISILYFKK